MSRGGGDEGTITKLHTGKQWVFSMYVRILLTSPSHQGGREGVPVLKDGNDHDWPKGLFLCHHHVILHVCEDCRLHEEPWRGGRGRGRGERVCERKIRLNRDR